MGERFFYFAAWLVVLAIGLSSIDAVNAACGNNIVEAGEQCDNTTAGSCCLSNCTFATATNVYNPSPTYLLVAATPANGYLLQTQHLLNTTAMNYPISYTVVNATPGPLTYAPFTTETFAWSSSNSRLTMSRGFAGSYLVVIASTYCTATGGALYFTRNITSTAVASCTSTGSLGGAQSYCAMATPQTSLRATSSRCDCSYQQCMRTLSGSGIGCNAFYPNCSAACADVLAAKPVNFSLLAGATISCGGAQSCGSPYTSNTSCSCPSLCGDGIIDKSETCDNPVCGGCCTTDCQASTLPSITSPNVTIPCAKNVSITSLYSSVSVNFPFCPVYINASGPAGVTITNTSTLLLFSSTFTGTFTVLYRANFCTSPQTDLYFSVQVTANCCGNGVVELGEDCDGGTTTSSCCLKNCTIATASNVVGPGAPFLEVTPIQTYEGYGGAGPNALPVDLGLNKSAANFYFSYTSSTVVSWAKTALTYAPTTNSISFSWATSFNPDGALTYPNYVGSYDVTLRFQYCNSPAAYTTLVRRVTQPSLSCPAMFTQDNAYTRSVCSYDTAAYSNSNVPVDKCDCSIQTCSQRVQTGTSTSSTLYNTCAKVCADILVPLPINVTVNGVVSFAQGYATSGPCFFSASPGTSMTCSCPAVCNNSIIDGGEFCDYSTTNGALGSCCTYNCQAPTTAIPTNYSYTMPTNAIAVSAQNLQMTGSANYRYSFTLVNLTGIPGLNATWVSNTLTFTTPPGGGGSGFTGTVVVVFQTLFCSANSTYLYVYRTITANNCGNGLVGYGEQCDGGTCCNSTCLFTPANTTCLAPVLPCDAGAVCSGTSSSCPARSYIPSGVMCRNVSGVCDAAEYCSGAAYTCPADVYATPGTVCRPAVDACDVAETCNGGGPTCPTDGYAASSVTCRASTGVCDQTEKCTGSSPACPVDLFANSSAICRPSAGICDPAEYCIYNNASCPPDALLSSSAVCRPAADVCDAVEFCTGSLATCPTDLVQPNTYTCRPSAGDCDPAETCNGLTITCPSNVLSPSSQTCRAAADVCDIAEKCTGSSATCPTNAFASSAVQCRASNGTCDAPEYCIFNNASCPVDSYYNSTVICRASAGGCDIPELCTGLAPACPADTFQANGYECRASVDFCDVAEVCSGSSAACPVDGFRQNTVVCRNASGLCDIAEYCPGTSSTCPQDYYATPGTTCRASADLCDVIEVCNGTVPDCPPDSWANTSTVCRPSTGVCDQPEYCTGLAITCPANVYLDSTNICNPSLGGCDPAEFCTGTSALCPTNVLTAQGVTCNASAGVCQSSAVCDGSTPTCPSKVFYNSTVVCRSSNGPCDLQETCTGSDAACPTNAFRPSSYICNPSSGPCMPDSYCSGSAATCTILPLYNTSVVCRPAAPFCDVADYCTGVSPACSTNVLQPSGTVCIVPADTCQFGGTCNGVDTTCSTGWRAVGASCQYDSNLCYADTCTFLTFVSTQCTRGPAINYNDGLYCNGVETCNPATGLKVSGTPVTCNDGSSCTTDTCSNGLGACVFTPIMNSVGPCGGGLGACTPGNYSCDGSGPTPHITCVGAVQPVAEICFDGIDNNCNGQVDEFCTGLPCNVTEDCFDVMNLTQCVTADCELGQCISIDLDSTETCEDGLRCTIDDHCDGFGSCIGTPVVCNDYNECTRDSCTEPLGQCVFDALAHEGNACDSGNPCAVSSVCNNQGLCVIEAEKTCDGFSECATYVCNPETGDCEFTYLYGHPCMYMYDDCLVNGACSMEGICMTLQRPCDDFLVCTEDSCSDGACAHTIMDGYCLIDGQCFLDGDFAYQNPCLGCHSGVDVNDWTPSGLPYPCDDGNLCTVDDTCSDGMCIGVPMNCTSHDTACAVGVCQDGACVGSPMNINEACDDGLFCTVNDVCNVNGQCAGDSLNCAQYSTQCSVSYCSEDVEGCTSFNVANYTRCSLDVDLCNGLEYCMNGVCVHGDPLVCTTTNQCLQASCNPTTGCVYTPLTNHACNDSNVCTVGDTCGDDGICYSGTSVKPCDDGNPCTYDQCDAVSGCSHTTLDSCTVCSVNDDCTSTPCQYATCISGQCIYNSYLPGTSCGADEACSRNDYCSDSGVCETLIPEGCNDNNACTVDSCVMGFGCVFDPVNNTLCDDGNACTINDQCYNGVCSGDVFPCPDDTDCLEYTCQIVGGAPTCIGVPVNMNGDCFVDDPCQVNGYCSVRGLCVTSTIPCPVPTDCIDSYTCEDGECMPVYTTEGEYCATENLCMPSMCDGGGNCNAYPGMAVVCDFDPLATPCQTTPVCISQTGVCYPQFLPDRSPCDDGNLCTTNDVCIAGQCVGQEFYNCTGEFAPDPCLGPPICDPDFGCYRNAMPDYTPCEFFDGCSILNVCLGGVCTDGVIFAYNDFAAAENQCTYAACHFPDGIVTNTSALDGQPCTFDNLCLLTGECSMGECTITDYVTCPDALSCGISYCAPDYGCLFVNNSECDACTVDDDCPYIPCKSATCDTNVCTYSAEDLNVIGCDDTLFCNGEEICVDGTCFLGIPPDCNTDNPCAVDACVEENQSCTSTFLPENTTCTNTDVCALAAQCNDIGECVSTERTPCYVFDPCRLSLGCNANNGGCMTAVLGDGEPCIPLDPCAGPGTCVNGVCAYNSTMDCTSYEESFCTQLFTCNRQTGECQGYGDIPVACNDNSSCTLGDYCAQNGTCISGIYDACELTHHDEQCQYVMCTEDDGDIGCSVYNYDDSTPCSTGMTVGPCSGEDLCIEGVCTRLYSPDTLCRAADSSGCDVDDYCVLGSDYCPVDSKKPDGTECSTDLYCALTSVCSNGECVTDETIDCSAYDTSCAKGVCSEETTQCVSVSLAQNTGCLDPDLPCVEHSGCYYGYCLPYYAPVHVPCTDDDVCTTGDHCSGLDGDCVAGDPVDCSPYESTCSEATCNTMSGECDVTPINEGATCNADDNYCTTNDTCHSGTCIAGTFLDCTYLNEDCRRGSCTPDATCAVEVTGRECSPNFCVGNCTAPFEWWSSHNSHEPDYGSFTWPQDFETMTICDSTYYFWSQMPYEEHPWLALFQQWLGATLNKMNGACMPDSVQTSLDLAFDLLMTCSVIDDLYFTNSTASYYRELLYAIYAYNSGIVGPGLCNPEPCFYDDSATSTCLFTIAHLS